MATAVWVTEEFTNGKIQDDKWDLLNMHVWVTLDCIMFWGYGAGISVYQCYLRIIVAETRSEMNINLEGKHRSIV